MGSSVSFETAICLPADDLTRLVLEPVLSCGMTVSISQGEEGTAHLSWGELPPGHMHDPESCCQKVSAVALSGELSQSGWEPGQLSWEGLPQTTCTVLSPAARSISTVVGKICGQMSAGCLLDGMPSPALAAALKPPPLPYSG